MTFRFNCWLGLLGAGLLTTHAAAQVLITEFMATNTRTLADEDGQYPDWLELYNPGAEPVNLDGWFLTDSALNLTQWRFPSVSLAPNGYLVVFASGKDRAEPGAPLHASFKLASAGEYLALVKPDGVTIAAESAPPFPTQVPDVSYGIPAQQTVTKLLSTGAPVRVLVPADDTLGPSWTDPQFDDSTWSTATTGLGFDLDDPQATELVADSFADFSGTQGERNWFYGYYNKTTDRVAGYQTTNFVAFPNGEGAHGPDNFWTGAAWDWFNGEPPRDELGPDFARPNGLNSGDEHWVIRRWQSTFTGTLSIDWKLAKQDVGGNGVTGRVLLKGTQLDMATIAGNDLPGTNRTLVITNAHVGDFLDFAVSPVGVTSASDDTMDGTVLSATIRAFASLANDVSADLAATLHDVSATAYARLPFTVANPAEFEFLTLRVKSDAGFVAYLNGVEIARANAPDPPQWNSTATAERLDSEAVQFDEFDLSRKLGLLRVGENVLAIHGLNASAADSDFLLLPELVATAVPLDPQSERYFSAPTPGALNGYGNLNLGPLILDVTHTPAVPQDEEDLLVTARVLRTFEPVSEVTLTYRVMFGAEVSLPMADDGLHSDGAAGDGIYGGAIPASASTPDQMVRYFITAKDTSGDTSRRPLYQDPKRSPQYLGTIVADPATTTALPLFHWFLQSPAAADGGGARCSLFFNGEFYDNILANIHGQSSSGFRKKSYDFDLNPGDHLRWADGQPRIDDFNLLTTYPDKALMRNMLAYETYRDAGSPYHFAFPVRVQRNGAFFSVAHFVENGDDNYLERLGLDPRGALYKMYNMLEAPTGEKKTRKHESQSDLVALIAGCRKSGTARAQYVFDNINVPEVVNKLAAMITTGNVDCCHKNYYLYRDTEGTGEWQMLPWDVDLSFGRVWNGGQTYWDEVLHPETQVFVGGGNTLVDVIFNIPAIRQMYLRRLRTLMDDLLQPTNTAPAQLKFERRIDELASLLAPDAELDLAKWKTFGKGSEVSTCCVQTLPQAVALLTNQYLPARRRYLYTTQTGNTGARIPAAQPANPVIRFGAIEVNPASGTQAHEFIELVNPNTYAVDISGWKLAGEVTHLFQAGVVLAATNKLYVSPDVVAFRRRLTAPRGGQGLFVQGNYRGQLSARGGTLLLLDQAGRTMSELSYPGNPTPAQQYLRITEIMYHPPPPVGSPFADEDYEFIELKNTGPVTLDLAGVHFTSGIEFNLTDGSVKDLGPGQSVVVVRNLAAFTLRYGASLPIAGAFRGNLDNAGEKLRLADAVGETVLEFTYNDTWDPFTDGLGYSLVILADTLPWAAWNYPSSWAASNAPLGSPGQDDAEQAAWRAAHFTLAEEADPVLSSDAADPDGDGLSNFQEQLSGTDPRDGQSYLKVTSVTNSGDNRVIRFLATAGKTYTLQSRDSLTDGQWLRVADVPAQATTQLVEVPDPAANGQATRYYRLVTPQLP